MPEKVVARLVRALAARKKKISGAKILVLGLAYKANVDDDRESPSYALMGLLAARDAKVSYFDPHVPVIKPTREHSYWTGTKSVKWSRKMISSFDAVLISTAHAAINFQQLADWSSLIVDTRNMMAKCKVAPGKVWKA